MDVDLEKTEVADLEDYNLKGRDKVDRTLVPFETSRWQPLSNHWVGMFRV